MLVRPILCACSRDAHSVCTMHALPTGCAGAGAVVVVAVTSRQGTATRDDTIYIVL